MSTATNKFISSFQDSTEPIIVEVTEVIDLSDSSENNTTPHLRIEVKEVGKTVKTVFPIYKTVFPIYLTSQAKAYLKEVTDEITVGMELQLTKYTISNLITENNRKGKPFFIVANCDIIE